MASSGLRMPFIALNSDNEEVTASHCRDEFLRTGIERSEFKYSFCFCAYEPQLSLKRPYFMLQAAFVDSRVAVLLTMWAVTSAQLTRQSSRFGEDI